MDSYKDFFMHFHFVNEVWCFFVPIIMIGLDILTGLIKSWVDKNFKSSKMRSGLGKKAGEIAVLLVGEVFAFSLGLPKWFMTAVSAYIIFMELMSNIENLHALGVPIPKFVTSVLSTIDDSLKNDAHIPTIDDKEK